MMAVTTEESESSLEYNATEPPGFQANRNYTGEYEKQEWWYLARFSKDYKYYYGPTSRYDPTKQKFRTRRDLMQYREGPVSLRIRCENSDEVGAFMKLTNSYCLVCCAEDSENFLNTIKGDLKGTPIINSSVAGCRMVGRMCAGNNKGLLLPDTVYDTEIEYIQNELPKSVKVAKLEERLSALGNVIACNDHVALVHPDIDRDSEEIIADTLQVEVFRHMIGKNPLVGSCCLLSNHGGLIHPLIDKNEVENLSSLLQLPLVTGTVNQGSPLIAAGMVANDWIVYAGMKTTSHEFSVIENVFHFKKCSCSDHL